MRRGKEDGWDSTAWARGGCLESWIRENGGLEYRPQKLFSAYLVVYLPQSRHCVFQRGNLRFLKLFGSFKIPVNAGIPFNFLLFEP